MSLGMFPHEIGVRAHGTRRFATGEKSDLIGPGDWEKRESRKRSPGPSGQCVCCVARSPLTPFPAPMQSDCIAAGCACLHVRAPPCSLSPSSLLRRPGSADSKHAQARRHRAARPRHVIVRCADA